MGGARRAGPAASGACALGVRRVDGCAPPWCAMHSSANCAAVASSGSSRVSFSRPRATLSRIPTLRKNVVHAAGRRRVPSGARLPSRRSVLHRAQVAASPSPCAGAVADWVECAQQFGALRGSAGGGPMRQGGGGEAVRAAEPPAGLPRVHASGAGASPHSAMPPMAHLTATTGAGRGR